MAIVSNENAAVSPDGETTIDAPTKRGRGRPRGTGRIDPSAIVDAALDALAEGGYRAMTMRGVARTLGVSLATVQHHFATKERLWRAAVDRVTADAIERRDQMEPDDFAGRLATFLDLRRPGLLPALLSDRSSGSRERLDYLAARLGDAAAEPTRRLRALSEDGVIRPVDERALFALLTIGVGAIAGATEAVEVIYGFDLTTDEGRRQLSESLADILGLGLLRRDDPT